MGTILLHPNTEYVHSQECIVHGHMDRQYVPQHHSIEDETTHLWTVVPRTQLPRKWLVLSMFSRNQILF